MDGSSSGGGAFGECSMTVMISPASGLNVGAFLLIVPFLAMRSPLSNEDECKM